MNAGDQLLVQWGPKAQGLCVVKDTDALCRSCGQTVIWVVTPRGKLMPVDPPEDGQPAVSHFSSCPQSAAWRKP